MFGLIWMVSVWHVLSVWSPITPNSMWLIILPDVGLKDPSFPLLRSVAHEGRINYGNWRNYWKIQDRRYCWLYWNSEWFGIMVRSVRCSIKSRVHSIRVLGRRWFLNRCLENKQVYHWSSLLLKNTEDIAVKISPLNLFILLFNIFHLCLWHKQVLD